MKYSFSATIANLVQVLFSIVVIFLGLRFILRFLGANPAVSFVNWVYETAEPLLAPFAGVFPAPAFDGGFVVEFSTLFALLIYSLAAYLLISLISFLDSFIATRRNAVESDHTHGENTTHNHHPRNNRNKRK